MTDKEVMLVVLNELISIRKNCSSLLNKIEEQRETLEAAITQPEPEPEPVAWMHNFIDDVITKNRPTDITLNAGRWTALYAAPHRKWVGLTDKEYEAMAEQYVTNCYFDTLEYAQAIEAKLKEKNT